MAMGIKRSKADINVTPMIDVLLVLLIASAAVIFVGCGGRVDPSRYEGLTFSTDGKQIFAVHSRSGSAFIYKIPLDTGKAVRFTNANKAFEGIPAFSGDGKRVVYTDSPVERGASPRVVIANSDGSDPHPLTGLDRAALPLFSLDNQILIFARYGYFGTTMDSPRNTRTNGISMRAIWMAQMFVSLRTRVFTASLAPRCLRMGRTWS